MRQSKEYLSDMSSVALLLVQDLLVEEVDYVIVRSNGKLKIANQTFAAR